MGMQKVANQKAKMRQSVKTSKRKKAVLKPPRQALPIVKKGF